MSRSACCFLWLQAEHDTVVLCGIHGGVVQWGKQTGAATGVWQSLLQQLSVSLSAAAERQALKVLLHGPGATLTREPAAAASAAACLLYVLIEGTNTHALRRWSMNMDSNSSLNPSTTRSGF